MKTILRTGSLAAVLGLLAACNLPQPEADTTRHFTLSTPASAPAAADGTVVRPVQIAGYLRGRAFAVRVSDNEVVYLDDVRWAETLDEGITQVLRARLGAISSHCAVAVQVQRCEPVRGDSNRVQLVATYEITSLDGSANKRGVFTATPRAWDGRDYHALVGQLRDAVGELADALAAALPAASQRN